MDMWVWCTRTLQDVPFHALVPDEWSCGILVEWVHCSVLPLPIAVAVK
jgi:hypothetical protein